MSIWTLYYPSALSLLKQNDIQLPDIQADISGPYPPSPTTPLMHTNNVISLNLTGFHVNLAQELKLNCTYSNLKKKYLSNKIKKTKINIMTWINETDKIRVRV